MSKKEDLYTTLLANQDFRNWVNNPTMERDEYWQKWMESNEDHKEEVLKAKQSILGLRFKEERLSDDQLEGMLSKIISEDKPESHLSNPGKRKNRSSWFAIAASLVAILSATFLYRNEIKAFFTEGQIAAVPTKHVSNPAGKKSLIKLPDGSTVILNANSSLSFPERFSSDKRSVTLSGEAFFQVSKTKDTPFVVNTGPVNIEVLGTSFNVDGFTSNPSVDVSLVEGKVLVKGVNTTRQITLDPGQRASYFKSEGVFQKTNFDLVAVTGWKDGILYFKDVSFKDFVGKLEQWYGVSIETTNRPNSEWRVNGRFKNESLEEVLLGVQFTYDIDFEIDNKKVILTIKN